MEFEAGSNDEEVFSLNISASNPVNMKIGGLFIPEQKGSEKLSGGPAHLLAQLGRVEVATVPGSNTPFTLSLQVLTELKSDNQRLKDENGALIRVISKLSK